MTARFRAEGRQVAVATSKPTAYAVKIMTLHGMENHFDLVMGAELDGTRNENGKSSPPPWGASRGQADHCYGR